MTQMLLFESAAAPSDSTTLMTELTAVNPQSPETTRLERTNADPTNVAAALEHDSGLHHMGDLARLVLLRYDLMAKRRAERARVERARRARQRSQSRVSVV